MVGTGANRTPLTKVHPVLLGKKTTDPGSSLLAHHRQQHQERLQQMNSPQHQGPPGQPPTYGGNSNNPYYNMNNNQQYEQQQWNNGQGFHQNQPNYNYGQNQPPPMPPPQQFHGPPLPTGRPMNQPPPPSQPDPMEGKKKRKRSRWGAKEDKAAVTGLVTLPADLSDEQRKHYLLQFKIEEITQKLRTGELGIPADPLARSPSPEPIYNSEGKRLNTREFRVRKQLEDERHKLIKQAIEEVPNYKPPIDYKPPLAKISDKVFIPAEKNPAVNFIGLLIGPRGNTLKRLEKETGCKIIIRGKGSVKEGKVGRIPGQLMPGEDEPLHALITGPTEAEVKKGVQVVSDIVKEGIECPDAANELRKNQLRELAELNGTLIDEEIIKCKNCGAVDHRHWECTEQKNVTSQISCTKCGGYGHVASDCRVTLDANMGPQQTFSEKAKMDTEYMSLMAELGVDAPPPAKKPPQEPPMQQTPPSSTKESKWGPPAGNTNNTNTSGQPQSLMDVNLSKPNMQQSNQFNPNGTSNQGGPPPPWTNQRGPSQQMFQGGRQPQSSQPPPPWQQNQQRGPAGYGSPMQGGPAAQQSMATNYPLPTQQPNQWQQPTSYPQWPPQYYQQPMGPAMNYNQPPPPWNQPPPPPPPPPPSS